MATTELDDFRNKEMIINRFKYSRNCFNNYEKYKDSDQEKAYEELNTSGVTLYEVFEWILKHYLYHRYNNRPLDRTNHMRISARDASTKANGLFRSKFRFNNRDINVDTNYLKKEMDKYADPPIDTSSFNIIMNNRSRVSNKQKHQGVKVDAIKYQESFAEIKKLIITYIDPNANIQDNVSSEYGKLQEACGFWQKNKDYDLALAIANVDNLSRDELELIAIIPWKVIFDFNEDSAINGIEKAYEIKFGYQPNYFNIEQPENTTFNVMSPSPYWYLLNGRSDREDTLAKTKRRWNQKYKIGLLPAIKKYHEVFPKQLRLVIVNGEADKLYSLVEAIDTCYNDEYKIYFLSNEIIFEQFCNDYSEVLTKFPMSLGEFILGINNFSSFLGKNKERTGYSIVGKNGNVQIELEKYNHFDVIHNSIANIEENISKKEDFLKAKEPISWFGVKNDFAINRSKHFSYLCNQISERCNDIPYSILEFKHKPGAGGTTLARQVAYHISKTHPVIMLKYFNDKITVNQVKKLYDDVKMSIVIFSESPIISEDVEKLHNLLKVNTIPHVLVYVKRLEDKRQENDNDLSILTDEEFDSMIGNIKEYIDTDSQKRIDSLVKPSNRYPFFISLCAFDKDFQGIELYVSRFLDYSDFYDKNILGDIAIVDLFTETLLPLSYFSKIDESDEIGRFKNNINDNLIALDGDYLKIIHPLIAKELVKQIIYRRDNHTDWKKGENLADYIISFIERSRTNDFIEYDSTISIMKSLLITRNSEGIIKDHFSPIITMIQNLLKNESGNKRYNGIGRIFKTLVQVYPNEAHFKAHLSRYYTNIEQNFNKGIETAKEAIDISETEGVTDALLYHIYGVSECKYVEKKLFNSVKTEDDYKKNTEEIKSHLLKASEAFEKTRNINHKSAGYISDIYMCIHVIDFAKRLFDCSTQDLIEKHKDSWIIEYFDRAITLKESLDCIQADEDVEFQRYKIDDKLNAITDLENCLDRTISMWEEYLNKDTAINKFYARRFLARARRDAFNKNHNQSEIRSIMSLMEENISQEPNNGENIRLWFNALRNLKTDESELFVDKALSKLDRWKKIGENREAYYYYFILICIKAIENTSMAEGEIPILLKELKEKTKNMPNKNHIYEWLGRGKGLQRLFKDNSKGKLNYDLVAEKGAYLEGFVKSYKDERSAIISSNGMEVFFTPLPTGQMAPSVTSEDIGKKVRFILGFAYDGVRALNKSVKIININSSDNNDDFVGKKVKCRIIDIEGNYLKVKMVDYRNKLGRIFKSKLPKDIDKYRKEDTLYAHVISEKDVHGKTYYDLSLLSDEESLEDWQIQLRKCDTTIE